MRRNPVHETFCELLPWAPLENVSEWSTKAKHYGTWNLSLVTYSTPLIVTDGLSGLWHWDSILRRSAAGISWAFGCDHSWCWLVACFVTLAMSLSDSPSVCASPKMWERTLCTHSSKSGSVGVGVLAVEVSCTDVVIEDGVVASSPVVLNCVQSCWE
jgi:hypothetical protein